MKIRLIIVIAITVLFYSCANQPSSGGDIVNKMYQKWNGHWYQNVQFEQNVKYYQSGNIIKQEVWKEIIHCPGYLHIRYNTFNDGNGTIYRNDSVYFFQNNIMYQKIEMIQHLLLLGFDIYFLNPTESLKKIEILRIDVSKFYSDKLNGKDVYIIGAANSDDNNSNQFTIDKENLTLQSVSITKSNVKSRVEFADYKIIEGNLVATKILFYSKNQLVLEEEYFNISFPKEISMKWFNPRDFENLVWEKL